MRKRLDVQSLLLQCDKNQLVRFLKTKFSRDSALATEFVIHFASTFDLEEGEFHLITNRIKRLFPANPARMTTRKARPVLHLLNDLSEQSRDCISQGNYRQAFVILSHINLLLDPYLDRLPEELGFSTIQTTGYELLQLIYHHSPAPDMRKKIIAHLQQMASNETSIPFHETKNPYWFLHEVYPAADGDILRVLRDKTDRFPEFKALFLRQGILLTMVTEETKRERELLRWMDEFGDETYLYETVLTNMEGVEWSEPMNRRFLEQYKRSDLRVARESIFRILQKSRAPEKYLQEIGFREYFASGEVSVLEHLLRSSSLTEADMIPILREAANSEDARKRRFLYDALKYLEAWEVLKTGLMEEPEVFVVLRYLEPLYEMYPREMRDRIWELMEVYLGDHFGSPALDKIHQIIEKLDPVLHGSLQNFLLRKIKNTFGHRKHFQKRMKELDI